MCEECRSEVIVYMYIKDTAMLNDFSSIDDMLLEGIIQTWPLRNVSKIKL